MKPKVLPFIPSTDMVSNPWREAIEGLLTKVTTCVPYSFPILGGRLLKHKAIWQKTSGINVSNPWREAIEETKAAELKKVAVVSNPWREAIEVYFSSHA